LVNAVNEVVATAAGRPLILMGDFNVDLCKPRNREFVDALMNCGVCLCPTSHTTKHRSTLDHIWRTTSFPTICAVAGCTYYSDHAPLYGYVL